MHNSFKFHGNLGYHIDYSYYKKSVSPLKIRPAAASLKRRGQNCCGCDGIYEFS